MSASDPQARLCAAGFVLPAAPTPKGYYASTCAVPLDDGRRWVHVSGQTCRIDGQALAGCCRHGDDIPEAARAAQVAALNALAALAEAADGLSNVIQLVRVRGFVNALPSFGRHSAVLDGASRVFAVAFADKPPAARTAIGVSSLPDGAWVEIEIEAVVQR